MFDFDNFCFRCMGKTENGVCKSCGFNNGGYETPPHHLKPKTILNGKYVIGAAMGEGGFGITYVGYDLNLDIRVAIKEYFPSGMVTRGATGEGSVSLYTSGDPQGYENEKNKFLFEAKTLAKFDDLPGIVSVRDFFNENGTAYIVMEFIDGVSLKDYLKQNGGKISVDQALRMTEPLLRSLSLIHKSGIIHRDISPDNIMITKKGEIKLLDFGAARGVSPDGTKSMSVQLKHGYAPEEQYRSHGKQGPWTDVYAICATIYRAITGQVPVQSLERMYEDHLVPPSKMGVNIDPRLEAALMKGMAVYASARFENVDDLYNAIYCGAAVEYDPSRPPAGPDPSRNISAGQGSPRGGYHSPEQRPPKKKNSPVLIAVISAMGVVAAAIIIGIILMFGSSGGDEQDQTVAVVTPTAAPTPTPPPPPVFSDYSASSTRGVDYTAGYANNYYASYAIDGDMTTAWSCDRNVELTPTYTLKADTKQHVSGIKLTNGYCKSSQTYYKNRRITQIQITYEGGSQVADLQQDAYRVMQDIPLTVPVDTSYISIKVSDTVYGDWKDIAISEISVY